MRGSHLCNLDLFATVKEAVSMRQVAEYYGMEVNRKGLCICPFHQDKNPSMKIYENGKGFYCFACGTGGDIIKFVSLYQDIRNVDAAKELAIAFHISIEEPVTYQQKREAELSARRRRELLTFKNHAVMWLSVYRNLMYTSKRNPKNEHFLEALQNLTYVEYMIESLQKYPEEVFRDKKAVRRIGEVERRVIDWYVRIEPDGSISR